MKKTYHHEYRDYKQKQEYLSQALTRVTPAEFYNDIFPDGDLERIGTDDRKPNMIIAYQTQEHGKTFIRNEIVFAGKAGLARADKNVFALCGMCTYAGRNRSAKNAYKCYGFAFDLDGVGN